MLYSSAVLMLSFSIKSRGNLVSFAVNIQIKFMQISFLNLP